MEFHIPFTFGKIEDLKRKSNFISRRIPNKPESKLNDYLQGCQIKLLGNEYTGICIRSFIFNYIILTILIEVVFLVAMQYSLLVIGPLVTLAVAGFMFFIQLNYPRVVLLKHQRNIEKSLISALQDILVQIDSGIPLFDAMTNISVADYGELSLEFKRAVRKMNSGIAEETVLEELSRTNPSVFFRRTLWQLSNGMVAGSDISMIILESIKNLNQEQTIQIEKYGSSLNPIIVFYMLIGIIIPALSITFLTVIASIVGISGQIVTFLFVGLFIFVMLVQVMFLGVIKSRRPSLLQNG